ncbi:hypothetical protein ACRRTK_022215 [Alexandromys fortis]
MEHKVTCVLAVVLMLALSSLAQDQEARVLPPPPGSSSTHWDDCAVWFTSSMGLLASESRSRETCTVSPRERINCGFPGVTATQCKERGCCFDDSIRGFPWCFQPMAVENPPEGLTHGE